MTRSPLASRTCLLLLFVLAVCAVPTAADEAVDYARDVRPILAQHCFKCHGPDEQKSGLRLDSVRGAIEGGYSGTAIAPGKSGESLLVKAITGADDIMAMPPEGPRLSDAQFALIKKWIDAGAKAPADDAPAPSASRRKSDHWSFQPVARPEIPAPRPVGDPTVRNPIDAFVVARLARDGLAPSPEADRITLIRRASLDLTGLPPSPAEVDEFLTDRGDGAYERLVDRLLASPHYGERQARHWLDLARYADSNGYTNDNPRTIWKYRDWVINALNRDMPFDQFTIEQFAGDMLPGATTDQIVATGFHRNTLQNEEGGTDPEEFRVEAVVDRVATTGSVFLGMSLGCARCHDHKYDPVSQRDFYQMFALMNGADEPMMPIPTPEQAERETELAAQVAAAQATLKQYEVETTTAREAWEQQFAGKLSIEWKLLDASEFTATGGTTLTKLPDQSILPGGERPTTDVYTVTASSPLDTVTGLRLEALTHESLPRTGPGRADNGNFVLSEVTLDVAGETAAGADGAGADSSTQKVAWQYATADYAQEKYPASNLIDGKEKTGWAIHVVDTSPHINRTAILVARDATDTAGRRLQVELVQKHGKSFLLLGRFRLAVTSAPANVLLLAEPVRAALAKAPTDRTPEEQTLVSEEYQKNDPKRVELAKQLADAKSKLAKHKQSITTTLVMHEREKPRETHLLIRGEYLRDGPVVQPDVPSVLPPLPASEKAPSRLELARWLVDPANPLVARVTVNRAWQQLFGRGLVETSNDFGLQGSLPSHPELLDYLASQLVAGGWSMKSLHKLIVTSATYRQASQGREDLEAADPENRLLGRQSRLRVEAEVVRDCLLAASGLLSHKVGGPSVFPPQPDGVMALTRSPREWKVSKGEDRYRRGMYTYFWRSTPHPFLKVFDTPDGNTTCTRRDRANTPLQALTLLNDEACYEASRALAARVLAERSSATSSERIRHAFRLALSREPSDGERACLAELLADELSDVGVTSPPETAKKDGTPAAGDDRLLAAWTTVSRALLNLDEFMTRE